MPSLRSLRAIFGKNPFDDLCPRCVISALRKIDVPHMVKISEYLSERDEALEPTVRVDNRPNSEKTTVIIKKK